MYMYVNYTKKNYNTAHRIMWMALERIGDLSLKQ